MPDKNLKVSTLSHFYIAFVLDGLQRLSGLFMLQLLQSMGEKRQNAALPFTLSLAVANIIASLSDVLLTSKHSEFFKLIGVLLTATGAALCFFTTNIIIMIICWGLIFGSGYGLSIPHLSRRLKSANSTKFSPFLNATPSLGAAVMPFVLHILNSYYGVHGSYLMFSGIILNYLPLSVAAAYNLQLRIPNIKWRVRKRSSQYYVSKQCFSNETKIASVESFINSLEPDLILKISQSEECEDEIKSDDTSVKEMAPIRRKRSDTKGNDLKELPVAKRMLTKNKTHSEIVAEIQNYEKGKKILEGSFSYNEVIFEEEENSGCRQIHFQKSDAQSTNIILTDNILEIAKVSSAVVLDIEKDLSEKCAGDNLQISKDSDAVILKVEKEFSKKCTDNNMQITKVSGTVILEVEKEFPPKCTDNELQIIEASDGAILNRENDLSKMCTDDHLQVTHKCDEILADITLEKNLKSAELDEIIMETSIQILKNDISGENDGEQSQNSSPENGDKVIGNILENENLTEEDGETSEPKCNIKTEASISESCTEDQTTKSIVEGCHTENLQIAEENSDISDASDKNYAGITERTLEHGDQNSPINPLTTNTDLRRSVKEKSSTRKRINKCPPLSQKLENLVDNTGDGIQKSSDYKVKVDVPLDIKVHVIECTFLSNEDYWFQNSDDERLKPVKNNYRKHSNSLMPGTYDNIDFNSPNWQKNFAKCSETGKPKLSSIYSISESTDLDTNRCPLSKVKREQSRICYALSNIKPIFRFFNEIPTPVCLCIILIAIIFEYNLVVLITIFADFGKDVDNTCSDFTWILVAFGVGGLAGTFCCCKISRTIPEKSHAMGVVLFLLTGLSTAGVLFSPNLNWLAGFYCILGALEGGISYIIPKFITEYIDRDIHSKLSSLKRFLSGLAIISIPYVIGFSRDELGDYEFLLQTLSSSSVLCAFIVYFLPHLSRVSNEK